jgi:dephospho-CoA kinase
MPMKHSNLYLIGLTGGIACGKSTVLAMLAALGARTIDADRVTHRVQQPGTATYQQIVTTFGKPIVTTPGGPIDRRKLGAIVFSDPAKLKQLERIVHPAVHTAIEDWLLEVARTGGAGTRMQPLARPVAVIDAIKLIEAAWHKQCNAVWVVVCPVEQQVERLMTTRGMSEAEARQRIAAQPSPESRLPYATVVIDNGGTQAATRTQIERAWAAIPTTP